MQAPSAPRRVELRGPYRDLFAGFLPGGDLRFETLVEGPAGTAKTTAILTLIDWLCWTIPTLRVLICRKTRASMTESVLVTLENKVWHAGHPAASGAGRAQRRVYHYPNGSEIVVAGLNNPSRLFSAEYDLIYAAEAIEFTLEEYELLFRAMRYGNLRRDGELIGPGRAIIADTNPGPAHHWLNQRFLEPHPERRRLVTRHRHNPGYVTQDGEWTPEGRAYVFTSLGAMTGHRRERMLHGLWVSAEGLVWPEFNDQNIITLDGEPTSRAPFGEALPEFQWYGAGMDFGFRDAGVLQLWGVTRQGSAVLIREHYRTEQTIDWWAERLGEWKRKLGDRFRFCIADAANASDIQLLNDRLGFRGAREESRLVRPADKVGKRAQIELVRDLLTPHHGQPPRVRVFAGATSECGDDPALRSAGKPVGLLEEIQSYTWKPANKNGIEDEETDPRCADHACDAMRYFLWRVFRTTDPKAQPKHRYRRGTFGHEFKHDELLRQYA